MPALPTEPLTILEGPDGSGKSTLAAQLDYSHVLLNSPHRPNIVHHGPYLDERPRRVWLHYAEPLKNSTAPLLYDRSWVSEPIYGEVMRGGEDRVGVARRRMLERLALSRQAVVIMCLPDVERCVEAYRSRKGTEYLEKEELVRRVHAGYELWLFEGSGSVPAVWYDYEETTWEELEDSVLLLRPNPNHGPGVGHWFPGRVTVLVGGQTQPHHGTLPFVGDSGSSPWLAEQLEEVGVPEHQLYWVNNRRPDDSEEDPRFLDSLRPRRVVALSRDAEHWLRRHGIDHEVVPHPQYWKLFRHHEPYPLKEVLSHG